MALVRDGLSSNVKDKPVLWIRIMMKIVLDSPSEMGHSKEFIV